MKSRQSGIMEGEAKVNEFVVGEGKT